MRLLRTYPTQKNMTRRLFSEKLEFLCRACTEVRESRYRTQTLDGLICSICFRKKLKGLPIAQHRDKEAKWGSKRTTRKG